MKPKTKNSPKNLLRFPVFGSMAECAATLEIPKARLQMAKKAGCPAFDSHGRIDSAALLRWLLAQEDEENTNWPDRLKRAQALTAEMELEEGKGRLVDLDAVVERVTATAARVRAVLDSKLRIDLPARLAGRPAEEVEAAIGAAVDQAYSDLQTAHK